VNGRCAAETESAEEQHRVETIAGLRDGRKCFFVRIARNALAMARSEEMQSEERAARNEVVFRRANEILGIKRQDLDIEGATPFLCECGDPTCTELIRLSLEQYEHVRTRANWFLVAIGHDAEKARTVEGHDGYAIIEKSGVAGRIAEEEDPRK
jgi:hypothetical protein